MSDAERVSKKTKRNEYPRCTELTIRPNDLPQLYILSLCETRHILLDRRWNLIRIYDEYPAILAGEFACSFECVMMPYSHEVIKHAKRLGGEIFGVLRTLYDTNIQNWTDYAIWGEFPPHHVMQKFGSKQLDVLVSRYDFSSCKGDSDMLLFIMFAYLKTVPKKPLPALMYCQGRFDLAVRILIWKGYQNPSGYPSLFGPLYGKEEEGLILIAMARNRPRGDNVFAQMQKDVLFRKIYPLIRWSLPLLV